MADEHAPAAGSKQISNAAFRRLPHYHQIVSAYEGLGRAYVSSKELSEILEINETLVRKDMADLRIRGRQKPRLRDRRPEADHRGVPRSAGSHRGGPRRTGHLWQGARAVPGLRAIRLANRLGSRQRSSKIGSYVGPHEVISVLRLSSVVERRNIKMLILTVPKIAAQEVNRLAIKEGVRAIWNFTPPGIAGAGGCQGAQ